MSSAPNGPSYRRLLDVVVFIENARSKGISDILIAKVLADAGWPQHDIDQAFIEVYRRLIDNHVPQPLFGISETEEKLSYLFSFILLIIWTQAVGQWGFIIIDQIVVDETQADNSDTYGTIAFCVARLLVAYPFYLFTLRNIDKSTKRYGRIPFPTLRRRLGHLTQLVMILGFAGGLVMLITLLLQQAITVAFLLKAVVSLLIGIDVYRYSLKLLKNADFKK
ncbi:MAG: DUF5671 domain-containing protein [Phormidesmis sp.]